MSDLIPLMTDEALVEEKDQLHAHMRDAVDAVWPVRDEERRVDVDGDGYDREMDR